MVIRVMFVMGCQVDVFRDVFFYYIKEYIRGDYFVYLCLQIEVDDDFFYVVVEIVQVGIYVGFQL